MNVPDAIVIRRAEERDIAALGRLGASLMRIHHGFDKRRFMSPGHDPETGYAAFLRAQMDHPETLVLVAERSQGVSGSDRAQGLQPLPREAPASDLVGYLYAAIEPESFKELRARAGYIHDLLVVDGARGAGAGRRLIDTAIDWLRAQGMPRVLLWTAVPNEHARRLFEAHGFRATMVEMTRELE